MFGTCFDNNNNTTTTLFLLFFENVMHDFCWRIAQLKLFSIFDGHCWHTFILITVAQYGLTPVVCRCYLYDFENRIIRTITEVTVV